jgi:hypothetical protein
MGSARADDRRRRSTLRPYIVIWTDVRACPGHGICRSQDACEVEFGSSWNQR